VFIDDTEAAQAKQIGVLIAGEAYTAWVNTNANGKLFATSIARAKDAPTLWPLDR
jgi:hypothetical protein